MIYKNKFCKKNNYNEKKIKKSDKRKKEEGKGFLLFEKMIVFFQCGKEGQYASRGTHRASVTFSQEK